MSRRAILTRFVGPTNYRGARIIAESPGAIRADGRRARIEYPYPYDARDPHAEAARALVAKMSDGWAGRWIEGATDAGAVFVRADSEAHDF